MMLETFLSNTFCQNQMKQEETVLPAERMFLILTQELKRDEVFSSLK